MKRISVTYAFDIIREFSKLPDVKTIKLHATAEGMYWQFLYGLSGQIYEMELKYLRELEPEEELPEQEEVIGMKRMMVDDERPPKGWWDECIRSVSQKPNVDDPEALCGWIYNHQMGPETKKEVEKTRATKEEVAIKSFWESTCNRSITACMKIIKGFVKEPSQVACNLSDKFEGK